MKIAILYICTGKYQIFWPEFYKSFETHFLPGVPKHYFVFTDNVGLCKARNVTLIAKKCEGFPKDSLFRFDMFLKIENLLMEYDYTFFMNSNMKCVQTVDEKILPTVREGFLVFCESFGYKGRCPRIFPYERNKQSHAYIPYKRNYEYKYVLGGVNGGRTHEFLVYFKDLQQKIRDDDERGIMAIFHDESHTNRFVFEHPDCKIIPYSYALAEGIKAELEPIIIIRDKTKVSDYFNKKKNRGYWGQLKRTCRRVYNYLFW